MARAKKETALTPEERLQAALVPDWEWPYKLPENWCWVKASAVARIYTGNSISEKIKADKYAGQQEGLLFIATKDIGFDNAINYETDIRIPDYPNFKIAPANTALLCIEGGSAGRKVGFVNREVCFGNKLCVFAAEKVNSKFIYYILQSQYFIQQFNNRKHGLIGGVSVNDLAEIGFPLSPLAEQQRIVDRIESLFAKLDEAKEKAQAVVDSFETRKAAILHKAFTGELTKKWRKSANTRWVYKKIKDCCKLGSGGTPSRKVPDFYKGDIPWIKTGEIEWNDIYDTEEKITQNAIDNSSARCYKPGVVLVAMYGMGVTRGKASILRVQAATNQAVCVLEPQSALLYNRYLLYYFMRNYWDIREKAVGGNQLNLSLTIIKELNIEIPPIDEQVEIVQILDDLFAKEQQTKEAAEAVLDQIDLMKKSILARAFRGELGTNDPSEESMVELLKEIIRRG